MLGGGGGGGGSHLSVSLSVCLSIYLSICLSVPHFPSTAPMMLILFSSPLTINYKRTPTKLMFQNYHPTVKKYVFISFSSSSVIIGSGNLKLQDSVWAAPLM